MTGCTVTPSALASTAATTGAASESSPTTTNSRAPGASGTNATDPASVTVSPSTSARLGEQQRGPAALNRGGPRIGEGGGILQRVARGLDRLEARKRAPGGLPQQDLLVGQGEVHLAPACFSIDRSSLKGTPLSSR